MKTQEIHNHQEGQAWVKKHPEIWSSPGVVLLNGPMGAGKTQMVRWILAELGSQEVASPTFAVHHRYDVVKFEVDHFDLYRLNSEWDLDETGFWDMVNETENLVLVEWADRLPKEAFPKNRRIVQVNIDLRQDGVRVLTWG